ncbi:MAG TPA: hypothetical protein VNA89_16000 [Gemmatimonadaceae bacterium]|nr:hypothetical protein [Gemmatimonadaceae bacterium]
MREIATPSIPPKLLKFLGGDRRRGGWLVFESTQGEKRRLSPYPADWGTIPSAGLEQWCAQATLVPPGPARREVDQDPSSSSTR